MSDSFASRFMTPEEKQAMVARDPQSAQALTNAPRTGFAHNCYAGGLGMFFQKTIKNTILEKFLDQAWQGFLKYRCAGLRQRIVRQRRTRMPSSSTTTRCWRASTTS